MDYGLLGKRVREERHKLKLTQENLAEKVGVSVAFIGQIERGERSLSLDTLVKLAVQLGVTVDYLLQDSIQLDDAQFIDQIKQIMLHRTAKEKQMALDLIKLTFSHLDVITDRNSE